jgi:hypothetical protein
MFSLASNTRRAMLVSGAAVILAVAAISVASAQQPPAPSPAAPGQAAQPGQRQQAFLEALSRRLGIPTDRLQQAIIEARTEVGMRPGFGFGRGEGGHRFGRGVNASVVAQAIGITVQQLRQELPGKSLAQVAEAHGRNPADVATALKNTVNQRIDQRAATGRLTAERATQLKERRAQRIDQLMNQVVPQGGRGLGEGFFGERDD